jgi:glycopeptide antibiotics resistance protein
VVATLAHLGLHTSIAVLEGAANLVMFLPFGVLGLVLATWRPGATRRPGATWRMGATRPVTHLRAWLVVTAAGFVFSGLIETVQLAIPGRVSSLQDVALNGCGALLGASVTALVRAWRPGCRQPSAPRS